MMQKKKIWLFIAAVLVTALVFLLMYLNRVNQYQKTVSSMTFGNLMLENIADGVYVGDCDVEFIYAKVAVTVKDGQIEKIDLLEHKNDRGTSAERIIEQIVKAQSLEVDAVSGATNSSKVIKKAVANALGK